MVVVFLPKKYDDCPSWFHNYINWLTDEFDMNNQTMFEVKRILTENLEEHNATVTIDEDTNFDSITFESAAAYTFFLLKWA